MKKSILILAATSWLCAACSPVLFFQQIATLSSENVEIKNDGSFTYEDAMVTIDYDFWSESGKFSFIVTNKTDDDIHFNLDESYFVNNGSAYDYYQARTYVYTSRNVTSVSETNAVRLLAVSKSAAAASESSTTVEFAERPVVCIPAHTSKRFEEFSVATSVFRECGFVRDPSKKETAVRDFTDLTSPRVIENRLVFQLGDIKLPVSNVFYVSQFMNVSNEAATEYIKAERCDGTKRDVNVHKYSANNRFYIFYDQDDLWSTEGSANDRTKTSFGKSSGVKFRDSYYR